MHGATFVVGCCLATACLNQGDCPNGGLPFCILECSSDGDCEATGEELNACLIRVCSRGECLPQSICSGDEACLGGECRKTCEADADCNDNNPCTDDRCSDAICEYGAKCGPCQLCDPQTGACSGECPN